MTDFQARRSYYNLTDKSTLSDKQLQELVENAIKFAPSAFNSQTSRAVLVLGAKHKELWTAIWNSHKVNLQTPEEEAMYRGKFDGFEGAYGTVCFFEDQDAIDAFVAKVPMVKMTMPAWSANTSGMVQFIVWSGLAADGMGANLQHYGQYTPQNHETINDFLGVPKAWIPTAQMPFGVPSGEPGNPARPKTFLPLEDRVKVVQ